MGHNVEKRPRSVAVSPHLSYSNHYSPWRRALTLSFSLPRCLPCLNLLIRWVRWLQVDAVKFFFFMVRCVSNTTTAVPRTSKTKAIHDAVWRSLKPRTFSRVKTALKPKMHSNPKKSSPVSGPTVRHQKKQKVSSNKGWSNSSFVLRVDTNVTSNTVQLSFAYGEDVPEDEPRRHVPSHPSIEDQFPVSDLPPDLACRKQVKDPVDDESVLSQSDGSKTLDSQDYKSEDGQEDLRVTRPVLFIFFLDYWQVTLIWSPYGDASLIRSFTY